MSCASGNRMIARLRGMSLLELLVALAIALAFLSGVVLAFIELMESSDRAQARLNATANGRHALETVGTEVTRALAVGPDVHFVGASADYPGGDLADDDRDAARDEEVGDGHDQDGDWTSAEDRHALLNGILERNRFVGLPDFGDGAIDEDNKFAAATLTITTDPSSPAPTTGTRQVRYYLGSYDSEPNVLLQELTIDLNGPTQQTTTSPIAFGVVSFNALFWDQEDVKQNDALNGWKRSWNSDERTTATLPRLPVSVLLSIGVYAGSSRELADLLPNEIREVVNLTTVANVQGVMISPEYASIREDYTTGTTTSP